MTTPRVDYAETVFTAALVTVTTEAGLTYRRVFLKPDKAARYADTARSMGGVATVERVTVQRRAA